MRASFRVQFGLQDLLGLLLLAALCGSGFSVAGDPGVGWHLRAGQEILQQGAVPLRDSFSISHQPWLHNQWLADVLFAAFFQMAGWPALHALVIIVVLWTYTIVLYRTVVLYRTGAEQRVPPLIAFVVCALCAMVGSVQWFLRPVVFSFLCFAFVADAVANVPRSDAGLPRRHWLLVALFLCWANLHPAFILGIALLGSAVLDVFVQRGVTPLFRQLCWLFALCVGATFCNPFGPALWGDVLGLARSDFFMNLNSEWLPVDLRISLFSPFVLLVVSLLLLGLRRMQQGLSVIRAILLAAFICAGFLQRRYLPFAAIILAPDLAQFLQRHLERVFTKLSERRPRLRESYERWQRFGAHGQGRLTEIALSVLCVAVLISGHLPFRTAESSEPPALVEQPIVQRLAEQTGPIRLFHSADVGGYLTLALWPQIETFIDDRNQLHGEQRYLEMIRFYRARPGWHEVLTMYDFNFVLADLDAPVVAALEAQGWQRAVIAGTQVLLRR